jgi:hypothetical protein
MITFRECGKLGRLGNQLFQIAAGLSLAKDNNDIFRHPWYCSYTNNNMYRFFKNSIEYRTDYSRKPHMEYRETPIGGSYSPIPYISNMNLYGYFQSEKYFENNKDIVRNYFEPSNRLVVEINSKYKNLLNKNNSNCAVHVRRYNDAPPFRLADNSYYIRAINLMASKKNITNFVIFSDDIPWCKDHFLPFKKKYNFVLINNDSHRKNKSHISELFLMSYCSHNIISNSSFSWWGSWLNKNPDKIIIAPNKWLFGPPHLINKDIYRSDMILI